MTMQLHACMQNYNHDHYSCALRISTIIFIIEFDKSIDGVFSAGNKYICTYETGK